MEVSKEYIVKLSVSELEKLLSSLKEDDPLKREILDAISDKSTAEELLLEDEYKGGEA